MKSLKGPTSACRHCRLCRNFIPEGRRGGICQQLGVPVRSSWKACSLAIPAFSPSWEMLEEVGTWQRQTLKNPDLKPLECYAFNSSQLNFPVNKNIGLSETLATDRVMV